MMHKASENLQTAIEKGRTDIVRTIIEACQKCKVFQCINISFLVPTFCKVLYYRPNRYLDLQFVSTPSEQK